MRVRSVLAVGAVVALLLSGCSRGQEANQTLPTASSSASAEATLEPLGPPDLPMPAEAREQTPAGAEAFVRYYAELINRAQVDLDGSFLTQFSVDCSTCETLADGFASYAASGYIIKGGEISVGDMNPPTLDGVEADFVAPLSQAATTVTDATGQPVPDASVSAGSYPGSGGFLLWSRALSAWTMNQLTIN